MTADEFARRHVALTRRLARVHAARTYPEDRDDVESDAWLGLARAADTYDPTQGASEATHVRNCIHWAVLDGQRERRGRTDAQQDFNTLQRRAASLEQPPVRDARGTWADILPTDTTAHDEAVHDHQALAEALRCINTMTGRRRETLTRTYLDGERLRTLATEWGVTEAYVCLLRRAALARLRWLMEVPGATGQPQPRTGPAPCGTPAAYRRHYKAGQKPCGPCRAAYSTYTRRRYRRQRLRSPS